VRPGNRQDRYNQKLGPTDSRENQYGAALPIGGMS
jgi:hypothetical protein